MKNFLSYIRSDDNNILILNYLLLFFASMILLFRSTSWIILVMLIVFFLGENFKKRLLFALNNKVVQAFLLYFLMYIVWMIGSENIDIALYEIKGNLLLLYPILFIAIIRKDFAEKIFITILIFLALSSILHIMIYFQLVNIPFTFPAGGMPFLYKSDMGFFLLVCIGYSLLKLFIENDIKIWYRYFSIIFLILATVTIFTLGARTYMFIYIVAILSIGIMVYKKNIFKIFLFFIGGLIIVVSFYKINSTVNSQINDIIDGIKQSLSTKNYDSSSGARVGMIYYSLPVIEKNFVWGVGTGDHVKSVVEEILNDPSFDGSIKYAELLRALHIGKSSFLHNTYIQHLVQFGIVGTMIFFNIFLQLMKYKTNHFVQKYIIILIVVLFLTSSFSGLEFMFNKTGIFFVLIVSLLLNKYQITPKRI